MKHLPPAAFIIKDHMQEFTCKPLFDERAPKSPKNDLGEGPCWDHRTNTLYWVDIKGQEVCSYHAPSNATTRRFVDRPEKHLPQNRFNDGKVSPCGRLFAGTMQNNSPRGKQGALYMLPAGLSGCTPLEVVGPVTISNGLGWSLDGHTMYYIDSPTRSVMEYAYDPSTGSVTGGRTFIDFNGVIGEGEVPDGMTIDANGDLWVAFWNGSCVRRFCSKTGSQTGKVAVPAACVTSVCFGGPNMDELFITTAIGTGEQISEGSGKLYVADVGVKGGLGTLFEL
jgi:sugar lactone lactonase YvrE